MAEKDPKPSQPKEVVQIDRAKLRDAIRRLGDEYIYFMLSDAIDLLSEAKLAKLVSPYIPLSRLEPEAGPKKTLLEEVRAFDTASRAGAYYTSFDVNWRNCTQMSTGTRAFVAECNRLLGRCVAQARKGEVAETRQAIEILLGLLRCIDEHRPDIVFFADEAGAWQGGVDWAAVLPALFRCLSKTSEPEEYVRLVVEVIEEFDKESSGGHLDAAKRIATAPQRLALARYTE